jgi:hypothetical protein
MVYENLDLIFKDGKYYIVVKINDDLTLQKQVSQKSLETLISKYRQVKL